MNADERTASLPADPVNRAIADEQLWGARASFRLRLYGAIVIALLLVFQNGWAPGMFYWPFLAGFVVIGYFNLICHRKRHFQGIVGVLWPFLPPLADAALTVAAIASDNPYFGQDFPANLRFGFSNAMYMLLPVAASIFSYIPRAVMFSGLISAILWCGVKIWFKMTSERPYPLFMHEVFDRPIAEQLATVSDPAYIPGEEILTEGAVLILLAAALAFLVHRARLLVESAAEQSRERANLARYFSPERAEELAHADAPLAQPRTQPIAVMFIDIVGFTDISERTRADALIGLLRDLHRIFAHGVFAHRGTVEKFTGDGLMATFGTPQPASDDPARALEAALEVLKNLQKWNERNRPEDPVAIGIGIHYGTAILGDIGDDNRLEFAVLGDTVNVASRLERLTRKLHTPLAVSSDLYQGLREQAGRPDLAAMLTCRAEQRIRGRRHSIMVYTLGSGP